MTIRGTDSAVPISTEVAKLVGIDTSCDRHAFELAALRQEFNLKAGKAYLHRLSQLNYRIRLSGKLEDHKPIVSDRAGHKGEYIARLPSNGIGSRLPLGDAIARVGFIWYDAHLAASDPAHHSEAGIILFSKGPAFERHR